MSSGIAQGKEGMEGAQGFFGPVTAHVLRLIEDEDRAGLLDKLEGKALTRQALGGLEDDVGGFVEGIEGDNEDFNEGGSGEGAQLAELTALVLDDVDGFVLVESAEVITGDLEIFDNAFVDGDGGNNDDKLTKCKAFAQLVDGTDVGVGFAGAGLHLDSEAGVAPGFGASAIEDHAVIDLERSEKVIGRQIVGLLDGTQVVEEPGFVEIAERREVRDDLIPKGECSGTSLGKAFEEMDDALNGIELVLLGGIELEAELGGHDQITLRLQRSAS